MEDYKDEKWWAWRDAIFPLANVRADLYFLLPEEGGRKSPRWDGIRMPVHLGGSDHMTVVVFAEDPSIEAFELGKTYPVRIRFIWPELGLLRFRVGDTFELCPPLESRGLITEVLGVFPFPEASAE